jgi:hypothetical protein
VEVGGLKGQITTGPDRGMICPQRKRQLEARYARRGSDSSRHDMPAEEATARI